MFYTDEIRWNKKENCLIKSTAAKIVSCPKCDTVLESGEGEVLKCPECGLKFTLTHDQQGLFLNGLVQLQDAESKLDEEDDKRAITRLNKAQKAFKQLLNLELDQEERIYYQEYLIEIDQRLSDAYFNLKEMDKSLAAIKRAVSRLEKLNSQFPREIYSSLLADMYDWAHTMSLVTKNNDLAEKYLERMMQYARQVMETSEKNRRVHENHFMWTCYQAASSYKKYLDNKKEKAIECYRQILPLLEKRKKETPRKKRILYEQIAAIEKEIASLQKELKKEQSKKENPASIPETDSKQEKNSPYQYFMLHTSPEDIEVKTDSKESAQPKTSAGSISLEEIKEKVGKRLESIENLINQDQDQQALEALSECVKMISSKPFDQLKRQFDPLQIDELKVKTKYEAANLYLDLRQSAKAKELYKIAEQEAWKKGANDQTLYYGGACNYMLAFLYAKEENTTAERQSLIRVLDFFEEIFKQTRDKKMEEQLEGELPYLYYKLALIDINNTRVF